MKYLTFLSLVAFCSSCSWLASHPLVGQDLKQIGSDVAKDADKTAQDALNQPVPTLQTTTAPITPIVQE